MLKLLKALKELKKKGFASKEEKEEIAKALLKLKTSEQEAIAEDAEEVNDLPEKDPNASTDTDDDDDDDDVSDEDVEKGIKSLFERSEKRITQSIKSEIKEYLEEQRSLMEKKAGVYHPDLKGKRKAMNEHLREVAKALLEDNSVLLKEMTSDATGSPYAGYTIDSELSAEIRHLITEYGVARREMSTIQLTKKQYSANNLATDITVYWITSEGGSIKSSQVVLGQEDLTLTKLAVIVSLTTELLEETEIDFISFLASRVAEGFAQAEDEAFFKGDGSSTYGGFTGLLEASDGNEVTMTGTTFASISAEDLINMVDATPAGALANGKFYMHRTILSYVRKLREDAVTASDGKGGFIYQSPADGGPATAWGYPIVLVEAMPAKTDTAAGTSFVLFGDLRKACILGYNAAIKMARFNAGVVRNVADNADINLITTDREAVRWTHRVGYIRILPTAVTKLTTAAASA
jgi:HK97 family phage major capsid protein